MQRLSRALLNFRALQCKQRSFHRDSSRVADQSAVCSDHTVAGDKNGQRIAVVGITDSTAGLRLIKSCRYVRICGGLAVRDLTEISPDPLLKFAALRRKRTLGRYLSEP